MKKSVSRKRLHLDRLSELPEPLLHHILSFLSMRDVVSTILLSKRWENLWNTLPCLNFTHVITENDEPDSRVRNFINRALMLWKGAKLQKFTIEIQDHFDKSLLGGDMDLWVRFAVQNEVEELNIHLECEYDDIYFSELEEDVFLSKNEYTAPQCLNLCSSIKKLSLVCCNLRIPVSPAWNELKSLKLDGYCFSESVINRILLGTPQLEVFELRITENSVNLNIQSTSLKKLTINRHVCYADEPYLDTVLRICCPNLEILEISGDICHKCLFTTNVSSLTDATLVLNSYRWYDAAKKKLLGDTMRHIFSTFQHVERLTLSYLCFEVLEASMKENLFSPLPNVVFLKLEGIRSHVVEMVHAHEIFPNLKMLAFTNPTFGPGFSEFETVLSESVLPQLKIIEITSDFYDSSSIFRLIEVFLKHCSVLEKMVVRVNCVRSYTPEQLLEIARRLLNMPRSSPTANMVFN